MFPAALHTQKAQYEYDGVSVRRNAAAVGIGVRASGTPRGDADLLARHQLIALFCSG